MNTTNAVLNTIASIHQTPSDYAISKLLGVSRQCVSDYRHNRRQFGDDVAERAAELAKIDKRRLLTSLHTERLKNYASPDAWKEIKKAQKIIKTMSGKAYSAAVAALLDGKATEKQRDLVRKISAQCILCKIADFGESVSFTEFYPKIPKSHIN